MARDRGSPSGQSRELAEVRLPLLQIGVPPFLGFLAHIKEQGGVAGKFLNPSQTIGIGVEGRFEAAEGDWAFLQDLPRPGYRLDLQFLQGDDGVDQSHVQRLQGGVLAAEIPDLARLLVPYHAGQIPGTVAAIKASHLRSALAEYGIVGGDGQIAHHMQHMTTTHREAGHHRDHRLGQGPDLLLQIENIQSGNPVVADISRLAPDPLIPAGAKRLGASPGEEDHAHRRILAHGDERLNQFSGGLWTKGITHLGPVDRDPRDPLAHFVENIRVAPLALPGDVRGPDGSLVVRHWLIPCVPGALVPLAGLSSHEKTPEPGRRIALAAPDARYDRPRAPRSGARAARQSAWPRHARDTAHPAPPRSGVWAL